MNKSFTLMLLAGSSALLISACSASNGDSVYRETPTTGKNESTVTADQATLALGDPYPFDTCPVTGARLGVMGAPIVRHAFGRELRFCCDECPEKFESNSNYYRAKLDEAILDEQLPVYPLDECIVSAHTLGSMGESTEYIIGNRLIRMCCDCQDALRDHLGILLDRLDQAVVSAQLASYPLDVCIVSGERLGVSMAIRSKP